MDRPVRTYEVHVDGYSPMHYSARTPAKARWRCYRDYQAVSNRSFGEFLAISTIRRVDDPPGAHQRILVCGKPATRVISHHSGILYMLDGSDEIMTCHPSEVQELRP